MLVRETILVCYGSRWADTDTLYDKQVARINMLKVLEVTGYPYRGLDRPLGFQEVQAPRIYRP
jgi:hypothetical protein